MHHQNIVKVCRSQWFYFSSPYSSPRHTAYWLSFSSFSFQSSCFHLWLNFTPDFRGVSLLDPAEGSHVFSIFLCERGCGGGNIISAFQRWPYLFILIILINALHIHWVPNESRSWWRQMLCFLLLISQSSDGDKYGPIRCKGW